MIGRAVAAAVVVLACGGLARASDSPLGLQVGKNAQGHVLVSEAPKGTVAGLMGFKRDDRITGYTFNGTTKQVTRTTDLAELLAGTAGDYKIEIAGRPQPIEGKIVVTDMGGRRTYKFVPNKR